MYCTYTGGTEGGPGYPVATFSGSGEDAEAAYRQMVASGKHLMSGKRISWIQLRCHDADGSNDRFVDSHGLPRGTIDPRTGKPMPGSPGVPGEPATPGTQPPGFWQRNRTAIMIGGGLAILAFFALTPPPKKRRRRRR